MKEEMVNVRLPKDLWEQITKDAKENHRSATKQLEVVLRTIYGQKEG